MEMVSAAMFAMSDISLQSTVSAEVNLCEVRTGLAGRSP